MVTDDRSKKKKKKKKQIDGEFLRIANNETNGFLK